MQKKEFVFLPQPREFFWGDVTFTYSSPLKRKTVIDPHTVECSEGYRLEIDNNTATIIAGGNAGVFYAKKTLEQIEAQLSTGETMRRLIINDWPDFKVRGILIDISRGKVPTNETLLKLIDMLAGMKINQIQLYMEHTFAYTGHEQVWRGSGAYTSDDMRMFDAYCKERFIDLVPFQNSFGHMSPWLRHEPYRALAECPEGYQNYWSLCPTDPFTICPVDPKSLELIADLYDQMMACTSSRLFMVGADETIELGTGRSRSECEKIGVGRVYLNYIKNLHKLVTDRGRTMLFASDIIIKYPELIPELPKDAIAQHWGYGANYPFMSECERFVEAGVPFYVINSNSAYSSIAGRTARAVGNIRNSVTAGLARGALGTVCTEWGDRGYWNPQAVAYLGYAYSAACSWCLASNADINLQDALSRFVFNDVTGVTGQLAYDLGNVFLPTCGEDMMSNIYHILNRINITRHEKPFCNLSVEGLCEAKQSTKKIISRLTNSCMTGPESKINIVEFEYAAAFMQFACDVGIAFLKSGKETFAEIDTVTKRNLYARRDEIGKLLRDVWLHRNKPEGLEISLAWLERVR